MTEIDRAAWLEERRHGVGASDVAGILGLSPWASPYSVWVDKVFGSDDDRDTAAMQFGRRAEPMIAAWFHEKTGLYVAGEQTRIADPTAAHRFCTIDGKVYETHAHDPRQPWDCLDDDWIPKPLGLLQIKTTSDTPKDWADGGIPIMYQAQEQYEMLVTGADHVWLAVLHLAFGRPDLHIYELHRDPDDVELIAKAVDQFWHDHVVTGRAPAVDNHPATTYATKHLPASAGDMVQVSKEVYGAALELDRLKAEAKELEARIDAAENEIRAALGDATEGFFDGHLVVSHRPQSRAGIDAAEFRSAMPTTAAKFATTTSYRVLRTHKPPKPKKAPK